MINKKFTSSFNESLKTNQLKSSVSSVNPKFKLKKSETINEKDINKMNTGIWTFRRIDTCLTVKKTFLEGNKIRYFYEKT